MLSIMSPVVKPALAAGDPGAASTTTIVPYRLESTRPTSARLRVLGLEVVAILIGVEVAGERIDGFQHAVERAHRDAFHIGLFNVLLLDVAHYLAEDANVFERVVLRRASTDPPTKEEQKSETRRRAHDEILDAAAHRNL